MAVIRMSSANRSILSRQGKMRMDNPLARVIQREIKDPLTEEVLFGRLAKGGKVRIVVNTGPEGPAFGFEYDAEDEAALV